MGKIVENTPKCEDRFTRFPGVIPLTDPPPRWGNGEFACGSCRTQCKDIHTTNKDKSRYFHVKDRYKMIPQPGVNNKQKTLKREPQLCPANPKYDYNYKDDCENINSNCRLDREEILNTLSEGPKSNACSKCNDPVHKSKDNAVSRMSYNNKNKYSKRNVTHCTNKKQTEPSVPSVNEVPVNIDISRIHSKKVQKSKEDECILSACRNIIHNKNCTICDRHRSPSPSRYRKRSPVRTDTEFINIKKYTNINNPTRKSKMSVDAQGVSSVESGDFEYSCVNQTQTTRNYLDEIESQQNCNMVSSIISCSNSSLNNMVISSDYDKRSRLLRHISNTRSDIYESECDIKSLTISSSDVFCSNERDPLVGYIIYVALPHEGGLQANFYPCPYPLDLEKCESSYICNQHITGNCSSHVFDVSKASSTKLCRSNKTVKDQSQIPFFSLVLLFAIALYSLNII